MDTFFTRVPNVQNLTTFVIELYWKLETKLNKNALSTTVVENLILLGYISLGILTYTH